MSATTVHLTTRDEFVAQGVDPLIGASDEIVDIIVQAVAIAGPVDPLSFLETISEDSHRRIRRDLSRPTGTYRVGDWFRRDGDLRFPIVGPDGKPTGEDYSVHDAAVSAAAALNARRLIAQREQQEAKAA